MLTELLLADAGHTRTKLAHCRFTAEPLPRIEHQLAVIEDAPIDWPQVQQWFPNGPDAVVITGTNQQKAAQLQTDWPQALPAPVMFDRNLPLPIQVDVDVPEKVGIDRLLNAVAGNVLRRPHQAVITIDTGTAITIDVLDADETFRGGAILPGILLGARSLHEQTTTLPLLNVWELLKSEPAVLGKNTEAAISSGLFWGHLGSIREIVNRLVPQLTYDGIEPAILMTGGAAGIVTPYWTSCRHEPALALQGLALAVQHQSKLGALP